MTLTALMARCMSANISDTTVGIMQLAGSKIDILKSSVSRSWKGQNRMPAMLVLSITERIIFADVETPELSSSPVKLAAGDAVILLAKDVVFNEFFFDIGKALFINVIDLMPYGTSDI